MRSMRPARSALLRSPAIICGCTSTAITRPSVPTSRASSRVKKPSRTRLQDRHADAHEGLEHPGRILHEFADGARQNVADPTGADGVFGHGNNSLRLRHSSRQRSSEAATPRRAVAVGVAADGPPATTNVSSTVSLWRRQRRRRFDPRVVLATLASERALLVPSLKGTGNTT